MPKRTGHIYEKMLDRDYIRHCILEAAKHKRRRRCVARVLKNLDAYVDKTYALLASGSFKPSKPNVRTIYDQSSQKERVIKTVPFWPDAVVHRIVTDAMKPVMYRGMYHWSCASIPGRGGHRAVKQIKRIMARDIKGTKYAAELDIRHYYQSIPVPRLMAALRRRIKDERFLRLVESILVSCGGGLAIGYYICQWLANFYLEGLDHFICALDGVKHYVRYMDNMTLFGPNKRRLSRARRAIAGYLRGKLGLELKGSWQIYPTDARLVSAVGYRYGRGYTLLRKRNFLRFARQSRKARRYIAAGRPLPYRLAAGLLSRYGQLTHCDGYTARVKYIDPIGMRTLKEVIRNESKRRQRARGRLYAGGAA